MLLEGVKEEKALREALGGRTSIPQYEFAGPPRKDESTLYVLYPPPPPLAPVTLTAGCDSRSLERLSLESRSPQLLVVAELPNRP